MKWKPNRHFIIPYFSLFLMQTRSSPTRPVVSQQSVIVHASSAQPLIRPQSVPSPSKQPEQLQPPQRKETQHEPDAPSSKVIEPTQHVSAPSTSENTPVAMEVGESSGTEKVAENQSAADSGGNQSNNANPSST